MFCPNCGRGCGSTKFCPECGQELSAAQTVIEPPVGRYEAIDGYLDVSYYTMTIHKEIDSQTVEHIIDYRNIAEVCFSPAEGFLNGYLAIREKKDRLPPIKDKWDAACDEKTLVIDEGMNNTFLGVYIYFRQCISASATDAEHKRINAPDHSRCANTICCPKCKSNKCFVHDRPYQRPFVRGKSIVLAIMMCILYLCHKFSPRRFEYICLDCGSKWMQQGK